MEKPRTAPDAKSLSQKLIAKMREAPGDHGLWLRTVAMVDEYYLALPGFHGGSSILTINTLKELHNIHVPNCSSLQH